MHAPLEGRKHVVFFDLVPRKRWQEECRSWITVKGRTAKMHHKRKTNIRSECHHLYIYICVCVCVWFLNTMQETCFVFWWLPFSNSYPKGRQVNGPQKSHHSQSVHARFLQKPLKFSALANHHSDFYMYLYPSPLPFLEQVLSKDEGM